MSVSRGLDKHGNKREVTSLESQDALVKYVHNVALSNLHFLLPNQSNNYIKRFPPSDLDRIVLPRSPEEFSLVFPLNPGHVLDLYI